MLRDASEGRKMTRKREQDGEGRRPMCRNNDVKERSGAPREDTETHRCTTHTPREINCTPTQLKKKRYTHTHTHTLSQQRLAF